MAPDRGTRCHHRAAVIPDRGGHGQIFRIGVAVVERTSLPVHRVEALRRPRDLVLSAAAVRDHAVAQQPAQFQLGMFGQDLADAQQRLLSTLQAFFDCAANTSETAQRLHLRRQTLYQRLKNLSRLLGHEVTDSASVAELHVAVRLHQILGNRSAGSGHRTGHDS